MRKAILVLGMHRSGTSALTGTLALRGATPPRTLMAPAEHNPLGFWESEPFREFHDRLLQAAGLEWDLWSRFDPDAIGPSIYVEFQEEFRRLLDQEFGAAPLLVVKDPRLCRLLPFWQENLAAAGIDAVAVLLFRHPSEVAMSLQSRDGFVRDHTYLLWIRHLLDAEQHTRTVTRQVIGYQDLLSNWREVLGRLESALGLEWSADDPAAAEAIDAFLRPALRHHVAGPEAASTDSALDAWVTATHEAYQRLAYGGDARDPDACARLDAVRTAFDAATAPFDAVVHSERRRFRQQLGNATVEREWLLQHVAAIDAERTRLAAHIDQLDHQLAQLAGERQQADSERDDWRRRCFEAEERAASLNFERDEAIARSTFTIAELSARAVHAERQVRDLHDSLTWRWTAPVRALAGYLPGWKRLG